MPAGRSLATAEQDTTLMSLSQSVLRFVHECRVESENSMLRSKVESGKGSAPLTRRSRVYSVLKGSQKYTVISRNAHQNLVGADDVSSFLTSS